VRLLHRILFSLQAALLRFARLVGLLLSLELGVGLFGLFLGGRHRLALGNPVVELLELGHEEPVHVVHVRVEAPRQA